jgi:hypothetical protein
LAHTRASSGKQEEVGKSAVVLTFLVKTLVRRSSLASDSASASSWSPSSDKPGSTVMPSRPVFLKSSAVGFFLVVGLGC